MGLPQPPFPSHLYPQALQLKLYQAFIFSIPILFSIILFLLFYLFYLKRRASNLSSPPPTLSWRLNQATSFVPSVPLVLPLLPQEKGLQSLLPSSNTFMEIESSNFICPLWELKEQLQMVIFEEILRAKDSQCCVCLGEFEIKEELQQIPSCKHLFHIDCIDHWLRANSTCPLCRCSIVLTRKLGDTDPPVQFNLLRQIDASSDHHPLPGTSEQELDGVSVNLDSFSSEELPTQVEESSRARSCLTQPCYSQESSDRMVDTTDYSYGNSVVVEIQIHTSWP